MKKKCLFFFMLLCLPQLIFAYKIGDTLDKSMIEKIGIKKDKLTIVDFFASWCVSCEKELPLIEKLSNSNNGIDFIGIDTDENIDDGIKFQRKLKLTFNIINDNKQKLVSKFNPIGMPAIYFIKNYKIQKVIFGAVENIDKVIIEKSKEIK